MAIYQVTTDDATEEALAFVLKSQPLSVDEFVQAQFNSFTALRWRESFNQIFKNYLSDAYEAADSAAQTEVDALLGFLKP